MLVSDTIARYHQAGWQKQVEENCGTISRLSIAHQHYILSARRHARRHIADYVQALLQQQQNHSQAKDPVISLTINKTLQSSHTISSNIRRSCKSHVRSVSGLVRGLSVARLISIVVSRSRRSTFSISMCESGQS